MMTKFTTLTLAAALIVAAGAAQAGSIENLERERAIAIETLLSSEMTPAERHAKISVSKGRLIDLERIVLRDTSLKGRATPAVKKIFDNYDLAFLVHAATENNLTVMDHWLEQLGLTAQSLTIAQRRRR